MKNGIDCDGVFEILTRAPFPTGGECDDAVEEHLCVCHDCRHLAEALRPAVGLIHESLANTDSLPEYDGRFASKASACAMRAQRVFQVGPFLAAGLAACLVLWVLQSTVLRDGSQPHSRFPTASIVPAAHGLAALRSLDLPLDCLPKKHAKAEQFVIEAADMPVISAEQLQFLCCTQCHRSGGHGPASERAIRALNTACVACHQPPQNATALLDHWRRFWIV